MNKTMWTNGHMISPIKPGFERLSNGSAQVTGNIPDEILNRAGWWEIPYDEEKFLNRPTEW